MQTVHLVDVLVGEKTGLSDRAGAAHRVCLLGGLKQDQNVAVQPILHPVQLTGDPSGDGGVHIVAAGVHDSLVDGGERSAGMLGQRQGVDIRPHAQGPGFSCVDADKAAVQRADGAQLQSVPGQKFPDAAGGLHLLVAQLRMPVDIPAELQIAGRISFHTQPSS